MRIHIILLIIALLSVLRFIPKSIRLVISMLCYAVFCISVVFIFPLLMAKNSLVGGCFITMLSAIALGWYLHKPEGNTAKVLSYMLRGLGYGSLLILLIVLLSTMGNHYKTYKVRTYIHIMITSLFPIAVLFLARYLHRLLPKTKKAINLGFLGIAVFFVFWAVNPTISLEKEYMGETISYRQPIIPVNFQKFTISRKLTVQDSFERAVNNKMFMMTYDYEKDKNIQLKNRLEYVIKKDDRYNSKYIELTRDTAVKIDSILKYRTELFEIYFEE